MFVVVCCCCWCCGCCCCWIEWNGSWRCESGFCWWCRLEASQLGKGCVQLLADTLVFLFLCQQFVCKTTKMSKPALERPSTLLIQIQGKHWEGKCGRPTSWEIQKFWQSKTSWPCYCILNISKLSEKLLVLCVPRNLRLRAFKSYKQLWQCTSKTQPSKNLDILLHLLKND